MSNVRTSAGTKFSIASGVPTNYNEAGFALLSFSEVGEVTNIPAYGGQFDLVTHSPLGSRAVVKRKGSINYGSVTLEIGRDVQDAGQEMLRTAFEEDATYSFFVELQDGTKQYFTGQVFSYTTNPGTSNQITSIGCQIEIDTEILEVEPTGS